MIKADLWNPEPEKEQGKCTARKPGIRRTQFPLKKDSGSNRFPFGKYKGRTIKQVQEIDPSYLRWVAGLEHCQNPAFQANVFFVIYGKRMKSKQK